VEHERPRGTNSTTADGIVNVTMEAGVIRTAAGVNESHPLVADRRSNRTDGSLLESQRELTLTGVSECRSNRTVGPDRES